MTISELIPRNPTMIANHLFGACLPTFGNCADRYCLGGYGGGGTTMPEMLVTIIPIALLLALLRA